MNTDKINKLHQMGLGPVWQRRTHMTASAEVSMVADTVAPLYPTEAAQATAVVTRRPTAAANTNATPAYTAIDTDAIAMMDGDTLEASIRACTRCGLCEGRQHAVPGTGDRKARWLFVGEGPGVNEDQQGQPFVGPAGHLLDNMLRALDLVRGENTYIANIVKCRPTGADGRDRPPSAEEVAACMPYLERQITLIQPELIVALGKTAANALLGLPHDTTLSGLRGKAHTHAGVPVVVTYHPAYLLRKPSEKSKSWQDLCLAQQLLDGR